MKVITVSMTYLHHHLAECVELARAGNVVKVVNKLRGQRVECLLVAPSFLPETALETAQDAGMDDEQ